MILMSIWKDGKNNAAPWVDEDVINFDVLNSENVKPSAMESHVQAREKPAREFSRRAWQYCARV